MDLDKLIEIDRAHIWHPYSSMTQPIPVYAVESAKGVEIYLKDGRMLIDGMSSWWAALHGYNHPRLNNAITEQLAKMSHIMFGGITHEPAVKLTEKLLTILPHSLK
ncbi:aminotransferase class III-fold pyridoxal phosphate-dependent enzyme, partial [Glaesserella parasuis]|nr:aminotransferase class III-fold pyridoxal phosphate-dependent enzyme [Glaesserella parasuis]